MKTRKGAFDFYLIIFIVLCILIFLAGVAVLFFLSVSGSKDSFDNLEGVVAFDGLRNLKDSYFITFIFIFIFFLLVLILIRFGKKRKGKRRVKKEFKS